MAMQPTSTTNPYAGFGKVIGGARLAGRELTIAGIAEKLYMDAGSIAVIGNPRIGKTSVVTEAVKRLRSSSNKHITIEIDLSTLTSETELFAELSTQVQARLQIEGDHFPRAPGELSEYNAYKLARSTLARANELGWRPSVTSN